MCVCLGGVTESFEKSEKKVEEMNIASGPGGYGCSSCCVLMCEVLVFSVMLISPRFFVVLAGVCECHCCSSSAFFSPFGVDDQRE